MEAVPSRSPIPASEVTVEEQQPSRRFIPSFALQALTIAKQRALSDAQMFSRCCLARESHPWGQARIPALPQICYLAPVKPPHLLEPQLLLLRMEVLFLACSGWRCEATGRPRPCWVLPSGAHSAAAAGGGCGNLGRDMGGGTLDQESGPGAGPLKQLLPQLGVCLPCEGSLPL